MLLSEKSTKNMKHYSNIKGFFDKIIFKAYNIIRKTVRMEYNEKCSNFSRKSSFTKLRANREKTFEIFDFENIHICQI